MSITGQSERRFRRGDFIRFVCVTSLVRISVCGLSEAEPDAVTIQKLDKMLRGKFTLNPMTVEADTFFPDRCLSHGCASWAVYSSLKFADAFFVKMNLPIPYQHIRSRLTAD